jgi:hypothetical protein
MSDGKIDAATVEIIPPMEFPKDRPLVQWGPTVNIPARSPDEYRFVERPKP